MEKITTDFIKAVKHLHEHVSYILTELKLIGRDVKAIHDNQPDVSPTSKDNNNYEAKQYALDRLRFTHEKKAFCIGKWTLVVLAIYTAFTALMYFATKKAADAAKSAAATASATLTDSQKSFVINERPYVVTEGAPQFANPPAANVDINANVTLKNIGKTPARVVLWNAKLVKFESGPRTPEGFEHVRVFIASVFDDLRKKNAAAVAEATAKGAETDVAPNATLFNTSSETLSPPEFSLLQHGDGKEALFLVGTISYTDNFEGVYQTEFCWVYWGTDPKIWHICDNHNTIR
jgi:hypothetical protein